MEYFRIISCKSAEKIWAASRNCVLRIYRKIVQKKLLENKWSFLSFSDTEQNLSASCLFFWGVVKTAFYVSTGTLQREKCFSKPTFSEDFGQQTKLFRNLVGKISKVLSKTKTAGPKNFLGHFPLQLLFKFFSDLDRKSPGVS